MKVEDWKIEFTVYNEDCDTIYDYGVAINEVLPFLPRVGEVVWVTPELENRLDEMVNSCWRKNKCEDCPFMYGRRESEKDISTMDYIYVKAIFHNMQDKTVKIVLANEKY